MSHEPRGVTVEPWPNPRHVSTVPEAKYRDATCIVVAGEVSWLDDAKIMREGAILSPSYLTSNFISYGYACEA